MFTTKLSATVLCPTRPFTLQKGILMIAKPAKIPSFLHQGLEYLANGIQLAGMLFSVPYGQSVYKQMNRRKALKMGTSEQCILIESSALLPGVLQHLGFCQLKPKPCRCSPNYWHTLSKNQYHYQESFAAAQAMF